MEPAASTVEPRAKRAWGVILAWIGGISAVIAFLGTVTGFFGNIQGHFHHNAQLEMQMATAQSESRQGDYQAAVQSYAEILKAEPLYRPALDQQLQTTMLWVENYHVSLKQGGDAGPVAGPQLDQIFGILDAALARTSGTAKADVEAHLGWAHWLNQHIAAREFGSTAEQDLRTALSIDPNNVYAHAMLGNWMMQNNGDFQEAVAHLRTAAASGNAHRFVRRLQIAGILESGRVGARAELIRVLNEMRRGNEFLGRDAKRRILDWTFNPGMMEHDELAESLTAVPPDDVWQTFLWLDVQPDEDDALKRDFIQANLAEVRGNRSDATRQFRSLQQKLKNRPGAFQRRVDEELAQLSH